MALPDSSRSFRRSCTNGVAPQDQLTFSRLNQPDRLIGLEAKLQHATSAREHRRDQAMEKPRCMVERGGHPYGVVRT